MCVKTTLHFFSKQLVYKQLTLRWQIAKQLSGINPLSSSKIKNYKLKEVEFFPCNKRKIAIKQTIHKNSALLGKFLNH